MKTHKIFNLMLAFVFAISLFGMPSSVAAEDYSISISACPRCHWISVYGPPLGTVLTLTIDDPSNGTGTDYTRTATIVVAPPPHDNAECATFNLSDIELLSGFIVTVTTEAVSKTIIISSMAVTGVNLTTDTVSGIATPGAQVAVFVWMDSTTPPIYRYPVADTVTGAWTADYSVPGIPPDDPDAVDLVPGNGGGAYEENANRDNTWVDWAWDSGPQIEVSIVDQWIQAYGWPLGAVLTLTIDNPYNGVGIDHTGTAVAEHADFLMHQAGFAWPNIGLQPGFIVTVAGDGMTKTLIVSEGLVASVDLVNDRIAGIATPNKFVLVEYNHVRINTQSDAGGNWAADFVGITDLKPGPSGSIQVIDNDGDITYSRWDMMVYSLGPRINTWAGGNIVQARGWPLGAVVSMTISGSSETYTSTSIPWPNNPLDTWAKFNLQNHTVEVGDVITVTGNGITKILAVSAIEITGFDLDADTISGIGTPGAQILVRAFLDDGTNIIRWTTPDRSGNWMANFHDPGTSGNDPDDDPFDVRPGSTVDASEFEVDLDWTRYSWQVPLNQPPVAEAGSSQITFFGSVVTMDASASSDPDGDSLAYEWDFNNDGEYDDAAGITIVISFNQVGVHIIGLRVTDEGGLSDTDTTTVTVLPYTLKGFYQPVDMNGIFNIVKGGSTVPLKFEVFTGSLELTDVSYIKSLTYAQTTCDATATTDEIETIATGGTSLRYDPIAGQFIYNWKTPSTPGKCYRVTLTTLDGSSLVAYFKFK